MQYVFVVQPPTCSQVMKSLSRVLSVQAFLTHKFKLVASMHLDEWFCSRSLMTLHLQGSRWLFILEGGHRD